ncbi:MAG: hypothetical protein JWL81_442 [Verrucomicrobiales bacterium]|nr:hypothetical protein [Verrucomicrobiales bacterium]
MPLEYSRPPQPAPPAPSLLRNLGLMALRITLGAPLLFCHAWPQGRAGWSHLWYKTPWELPPQLTSLGFPLPLAIALTLTVLAIIGSLFILIGLLTRTSAAVLSAISLLSAFLYNAYPAVAEVSFLYGGAFIALCLCGPGAIALDHILRSLTKRRA